MLSSRVSASGSIWYSRVGRSARRWPRLSARPSTSRSCPGATRSTAYLPVSEAAGYLSPPLRRITEHTITDPAELDDVLARVRADGYATAVDELEADLAAVCQAATDISRRLGHLTPTPP